MNKKKVNRILNVFFATRLKVFLACTAMLLFWQETFSQTYPVQVQTTTKPPYYNYLNYYGDFNNNLSFVATLLDFNAPPVSVRLRLKISGPGYSYRTRTDIPVGNVFVLSPGMPTFIQGNDLLPYFNPVNLVAEQGIVNWNNMPEGLTTFCVEVIKVGVNNEVLSAESCSSFFLQLMQPPQPFLPFCNSTVDTTQMFHTFSWSPPLNYTPAFGAELNYNFSLYEWLDTNNYNIFQTGQGLVFSTQTQVPLVQVSNFDVLFQAGRKYVWRVQAQLSQNGLPIQMITQNGLSVPCSFYYGQPQSLAGSLASSLQINLNAQAQSERKGTASWTVVNTSGNGLSGFSSYILEYRKKPTGNENFEFYWFTDTVYSLSKAIYQLEPSTTYECRLRGVFGDYTSDYTPTVEFTTAPPYVYTCSDQNMPWMSAQFTPLAQAEAGMVWQIGQFNMTVTAIYGSDGNGRFSGAGRIPVEFLAGAQAQVTFVDILVDNEFNVREGVANVNTSGVDAWLHAQYAQFVQPIYVDGVVDTAYVQDGVAFVVVDGQTLQFEFDPPDYPIIIHDDNGVSYTIYPDGTVAVGSYFVISQDELQTDAEGAAVFAQHEQEQFGFDPKEHNQWHDNYEIILLQDESHYFVSNKSLALGFGDEVRVFVPASTTNPTAKLPNGTSLGLVQAPSSGGQQGGAYYNLSLPPFYSQGTYSVYIHDGLDRIGKLNIEVFNLKEKEVYIVPIASPTASLSDIEDHAKRIFAEANMQLTVAVLDAWSNDNFNASTSIAMPENVGNLDKYSEDMRALRDAYFSAHPNLPKDAYYVFVVAGFNNPDEQGYMVRGKSIGFVKANAPPRTYAHELAHGITALKHTWNNNGPAQGSTNNLMDYGGGENLTKAQWQAMRSWNLLPSFWDGEEEGMYSLPSLSYICSPPTLNFISNEVFKDLDGNFFSMPQGAYPIAFVSTHANMPAGSVSIIRQTINGTDSIFYPSNKNNSFGYYYYNPVTKKLIFDKKARIEILSNYSGNVTTVDYNTLDSSYIIAQNGNTTSLLWAYKDVKCSCGIPMNDSLKIDYGCLDSSGNGYFDPNALVTHHTISEDIFSGSTHSRVLLSQRPIKLGAGSNNSIYNVYSDSHVRKFNHENKEYIALYTEDNAVFVGYVEQFAYDTLLGFFQGEGLRYNQIPNAAFFHFTESMLPSEGSQILYRCYLQSGCFIDFSLIHDGRAKYVFEKDDCRFENTQVELWYYDHSCDCQALELVFNELFKPLSQVMQALKIDEKYYNPEANIYNSALYNIHQAASLTSPIYNVSAWTQSEIQKKIQFAYICGLFNGIVKNLDGLIQLPEMLIRLSCDSEFRTLMWNVLSELASYEFISNKLSKDFSGNIYQQAEKAGVYTVDVFLIVYPVTKANWGLQLGKSLNALNNFAKNVIKFFDDVKNLGSQGFNIVRQEVIKLTFTTQFNLNINLASFTDDGAMIIESAYYLDNIPPTHQIIYDFGETTYKLSDNATPQTKNLLIVKHGDDVKMVGGSGAGSFASHVDIQASLNTIVNLKSGNKLTKSIGGATDIELASIHRYSENGGVLNNPMRNGSEITLGPVNFTDFQAQVYQHTISGLAKLRQTDRLVTGTVIRGRTYSLDDYNALFNNGSTNVPLKGMVSCTKNEAVAIDFLTTSGANISGPKVKVIMKIKSKNGVDIDDFSEWGMNRCAHNPDCILIQEEVLLEEGMFKMIGEPKPYLENGVPKIEMTPDGPIEWKIIELEETGTVLRTIN